MTNNQHLLKENETTVIKRTFELQKGDSFIYLGVKGQVTKKTDKIYYNNNRTSSVTENSKKVYGSFGLNCQARVEVIVKN